MTDRPGDVRRAGAARRARGLLRPLAGMYGIQLSHTRVGGQRVAATADALLAGLSSLGAPVASLGDVPDALRARRVELWSRVVEPVTVAWDGRMPQVELRLPARDAQRPAGVEAELEDGRVVRWRGSGASPRRVVERADVEGVPHVRIALPAPGTIPFGYHTLHVRVGNDAHTSLVISAPFSPGRPPDRSWGAFLPLYALRTSRSWGVGDLADLDALTGWLAGLGGSVVATLPLLAAFLDEREGLFEPSPYAPVSRLFWNELYVDPTGVPELERSVEARALIRSRRFRTELESLRRARLVDYRRAITAKRAVLEAMARTLFSESTPRAGELRRFVRSHPRLADYARFRAACRTFGLPWRRWPRREREGHVRPDGGEAEAYRYHLYVQWLSMQQIERAGNSAREAGARLYFDLPLGTSPHGYDVWRERGAFVSGGSAGSPPDAFFSLGQNWGFPPLHPDGVREQRYRYVIDSIRHLVGHAAVVRIDHVMGLHRIYLVPDGHDARHGVYVRYRPEEFHAILALESERTGATVVGEDLGTVAAPVRHAMRRHGMLRSYVWYFDLRPGRRRAMSGPTRASLASVNTHDLPPFAAYWRGLDIERRLDLGRIGKNEAEAERRARAGIRGATTAFLQAGGWLDGGEEERDVLRAVLAYLAGSDARMVMVNLEDVWLETEPQNVPGTGAEYPNWRRPARLAFEEFRRRRDVLSTLALVDRLRKEG